ncbi:TPA_asm: replication initiation factor domain-containing protein [Salmonella enterica subsp. enterica serovar Javiana]|uniref:Replication initiation factor domain-containing protein n=1 Tax=Salmonella enterica subsp. enterica serovar Javiana TaxID=363569 RepID=A0A733VGK5_SALET|nr:replication initiation factor domain-containing protein [Salmonella enterica subsp. enterica serovar Javiana]HAE6052911.1 replication initiation factor domain-containing protein [Salmonella enterica subsp. enterica serovar Javiana]
MIPFNVPFCDYLTVTYSLEHSDAVLAGLSGLLPGLRLVHVYGDKPGRYYWCDVQVGTNGKAFYHKVIRTQVNRCNLMVTVYGYGMEYFRELNDGVYLSDLMSVLSEYRHNLTRCDISMDIAIDTPDFFLEFLPKVSDGYFAIRRDSLDVTRIINVRDDGQESGTLYIGRYSSARATCSIYDKKNEQWKKFQKIIDPRTRIEFRLGKEFGASLFDIMAPDSLFWELAHPKILKEKPDGIPKWIKRDGYSRTPQPRVKREINHYDVLKELIYENPLFPTIIEYSDKHLGDAGRRHLINTITRLIENPAMGMGAFKSGDDS